MKKVINKEYGYLEEFLNAIPAGIFAYSGKTLHKGRNEVKVFEVADGRKVVVKRFRKPNIFNRIVYTFFRGTKAKRAYENAFKLLDAGINTPRPMAYIDIKSNGLVTTSYLVTEFTDYLPVENIMNEDKVYQLMLTDALIKFTVSLHEKGINHLDFNQTNVLYKKLYDGKFDFMLIDINRMRFGKMSKSRCLSSIKRICVTPDIIYYVSQKYAELRGWDKYRSMAALAIFRALFECRNHNKKQIKNLIRQMA